MSSNTRQDMTKERISEQLEMSVEMSKTELQRGKRTKKAEQNTVAMQDNYKKYSTFVMEISG